MALSVAAASGDLDGVKFLLEHGANINARDRDGWTPILDAGYVNQRGMVRFLYRRGADRSMDRVGANNTYLSMDQAKQTIREALAGLDKWNAGY